MLTLPTTETAGQHGTAANAITLRLRLLSGPTSKVQVARWDDPCAAAAQGLA